MPKDDNLVAVANQFARDLPSITELDEFLWYVATEMVPPLGFDDCVIYRANRASGHLEQAAAFGPKAPVRGQIENYLEIPIGHGLTGYVAMTGESLIVDDVRQDPRYVADLEQLRAEVAVPILIGSSVWGVIDCESPAAAAFDESDLNALTMIARLAAPKIEMLAARAALSTTKLELVEQNLRLSNELEQAQNAALAARHNQTAATLAQLSGGIAHDFNNQLAIMRGALDVTAMQDGGLSRNLDMVGQAVDRATELTHRLLAFSSQQALFPNCINFEQVVAEMLGLLRVTLGDRIPITTSIADDLWNVNVDLGQLENAILNLALNARDAMPQGGKLKISCFNTDLGTNDRAPELDLEPGQYVVLSVADQGHGMQSEVRSRALDPYFTTKTRDSGTGLGLSMVYGFVRQSGGDMLLTSIEGEGTTAQLYFPRDTSDAKPANAAPNTDKIERGQGEVVLVVEDNVQLSQAVGEMLEMLNFRPLIATSAQMATELVADHSKIDIVLSDVVLDGGASGPALHQTLAPQLGDAAVVFMSGYTDLGEQHTLGRLDDYPFVQKPFTLRELAAKLDEALRPRQKN